MPLKLIKNAERQVTASTGHVPILASLLAALAMAGCSARIHTPFVPGHVPAQPSLVALADSASDYVDNLPHPKYAMAQDEAAYRLVSVAVPSIGHNGQDGNLVSVRYYRGKAPGAKPLVIVLPIWGIHA